jgi:hypothetical protein
MSVEVEPSADAYCPHCHLLIAKEAGERWPATGIRCPHCHLLVGAGRAQSQPSSAPGAKGAAAGVFRREAKRSATESLYSPEEVLAGIRRAAWLLGQPTERLLMVEYQQLSVVEDDLPPLSDVLAAFGSWKGARRTAASPESNG